MVGPVCGPAAQRFNVPPAAPLGRRWAPRDRKRETAGSFPSGLLPPHAVCAPVDWALGRLPILEQLRVERVDLDAERPADRERILRLGAPQWHREVAAGAG